MIKACPILPYSLDENKARINAMIVFISTSAFLIFGDKTIWIIIILAIDFFIKGFISTKYSYLSLLSKLISQILQLKTKLVNAGPKIFAAQVGFLFSVIIIGLYLSGLHTACSIVSAVLLICALLEAAINVCIACLIYPFIIKYKNTK